MTEEQIIKIGLEAHLLNYVDNETPRRYFVCDNADLEDVKEFARLVLDEQTKEIERLRKGLQTISHGAPFDIYGEDQYYWCQEIAWLALNEGKE